MQKIAVKVNGWVYTPIKAVEYSKEERKVLSMEMINFKRAWELNKLNKKI